MTALSSDDGIRHTWGGGGRLIYAHRKKSTDFMETVPQVPIVTMPTW
jgi:hypothetical protein